MKLEDLKHIYDGRKVEDIETEVETNRKKSTDAEKEFVLALVYLEKTNRFRENPRFNTASFANYIHDRFALTLSKYQGLRLAYSRFEDEVNTYGVGMVLQSIKQTGIVGAEKIFDAAKKMEAKKGVPVKQRTISDMIVKVRKPRRDFKANAQAEKERALEVKQEVVALSALIETKDEQIIRLKATVLRLEAENAGLRKENATLREQSYGITQFPKAWPPELYQPVAVG